MAKKDRSFSVVVSDGGVYPSGMRSSLFSYSSPSPNFQTPYPYSEKLAT
ncbi:MAG: hypothetical protein WC382_07955 [Methanoregulaceae archaeon]